MAVLVILVIYITTFTKTEQSMADLDARIGYNNIDTKEWLITREMWLSLRFNTSRRTTQFDPLWLVIIHHTESEECDTIAKCAAEMKNLEAFSFFTNFESSTPYNFVIGNDGRVYEGRGWNAVGAHTEGYNECTMGLAFIGNYREGFNSSSYSKVTRLQILRTRKLLQMGVKLGYLHPEFEVAGARDLVSTDSPGENIYKEIRKWSNHTWVSRFVKHTCSEIYYENHEFDFEALL